MHYIHECKNARISHKIFLHTHPIPVHETKHVMIYEKVFRTKQELPSLASYFSLAIVKASAKSRVSTLLRGGETRGSLKNKPF